MDFGVETDHARPVKPPTHEELEILRKRCDPQRLILGA